MGAEADAPSRRLRTKAAGEAVIRSQLGPLATIFKPAVMTGTEDRLFNAIAAMTKVSPVFPLIDGGATRMQPVWVRDVAAAIMNSLKSYDSLGQTYHLAGPDVLTQRQLAEFVYATIRERNATVPVPGVAAAALAGVWDWLGAKTPLRGPVMFSADYIAEMKVWAWVWGCVGRCSAVCVVRCRAREGLPCVGIELLCVVVWLDGGLYERLIARRPALATPSSPAASAAASAAG